LQVYSEQNLESHSLSRISNNDRRQPSNDWLGTALNSFDDSARSRVESLGPIESNIDFFQWLADAGMSQLPFYKRMELLHDSAREIPQLEDWPQIVAIIDRLVTAAIDGSTPITDPLRAADLSCAQL
jgi:hypothetical protein